MTRRNNLLLVIGGMLLFASAIAYFAGVPKWSARLAHNWSWTSQYSGTVAWADTTGQFAERKSPTDAKREFTIEEIDSAKGIVKIKDHYQTVDPKSGEVNWESVLYFSVNRNTGRSEDSKEGEVFGLFPRFTEKRNYLIDMSYLNPIEMKYLQQEKVGNLTAYLFEYRGGAEYTESYLGTKDYQGIKVKPGQQVLCTEESYIFTLWIEPVTGEIIKWREGCYAGDALFDMAAGQKLYNLSQWDGEMSTASTDATVDRLQWERLRLLFLVRYLWPGLAIMGVVIACLGLVLQKRHGVSSRA
ncbi:MAG: DUF3068 domain-containing protein [Rhodospirillaceae bacterium]|jgi:hypothetical protein|nr:DUF3068 domain-containing protein [Rhodospirillaceae bacterium]MBT5079433.1 DUF3068 domain-containing protein [Rhodospirillaceae bacterium]MBT5880298.1 DUF3068 domain-containing protein [Rhodospirillaceae bacterium]MBT7664420.1 DUF3068 domain-containing protein [Rhodospirillaceae bacterium]